MITISREGFKNNLPRTPSFKKTYYDICVAVAGLLYVFLYVRGIFLKGGFKLSFAFWTCPSLSFRASR